MNRTIRPDDQLRAACRIFCLPAVLMVVLVGCASVPTYTAHPELSQRKGDIRTIGLLPPVISMYEEQPKFGLNKLVPHDEWSSAAVAVITSALAGEAAANGWTLVTIADDDPELKDLAELYSAVEFSIQRHAWENNSGSIPSREPFPEKVRSFDYSVGPLQAALERYQVDVVWIVRGFNLLPTSGTRMKEGLEAVVGILSAVGGHPAPVLTLKKLGLSVALIDRTGSVLYYGVVDDERVGQAIPEHPGEAASPKGELDPVRPEEQSYLKIDLRDPRVATHYIKAALSGYRAEAAP